METKIPLTISNWINICQDHYLISLFGSMDDEIIRVSNSKLNAYFIEEFLKVPENQDLYAYEWCKQNGMI